MGMLRKRGMKIAMLQKTFITALVNTFKKYCDLDMYICKSHYFANMVKHIRLVGA